MGICDGNSITLPLYDSGRAALITTIEPQRQARLWHPELATLRFQRRPELHSHFARGEPPLQKRMPEPTVADHGGIKKACSRLRLTAGKKVLWFDASDEHGTWSRQTVRIKIRTACCASKAHFRFRILSILLPGRYGTAMTAVPAG